MSLIHDITLGQFYPTHSSIHKLDPRSKIIILITTMVLLVLTVDWLIYLLFSILLINVVYFSKVPFSIVFRNLRPFLWLFLLTFILNAIDSSGKVLFTIPWTNWGISDQGINHAIIFTMRLGLLIGYSAIFSLTTTPMDLTDGLAKILYPLKKLKFPVHEFAMMITLAIRFIPILLEEAHRIKIAQIARGARFDGKLIHRIRSLIPLLVPLFISTFRKADDIATAMESRCYQIGIERTSYSKLQFKVLDYASITGVIFVAVFIIAV